MHGGLIPRYRALAERGQVELSMTPYGHPIVPLLNDFANLRDALPDAPVPEAPAYPGGAERARWHLQHGVEVFEHYFGRKPTGVWLSEGGVSEDALAQLDEMDIAWTATGEGVWRGSCAKSGCPDDRIAQPNATCFRPTHIDGFKTRVFFRDDGLSDLIGFNTATGMPMTQWVTFIHHLETIASFLRQRLRTSMWSRSFSMAKMPGSTTRTTAIIFWMRSIRGLSSHPTLNVSTFAEQAGHTPAKPMKRLAAGSWVYGSFSTWIGSTDKNRGWDYLVAAKLAYDRTLAAGKLTRII